MTAAQILKAFDEPEDRATCLELCPEPAPLEKFAFERGKEAFAHGAVIGVSHRNHRGAHTRATTALAKLDRRVLRTLIGVMDHPAGPPCLERHVQGEGVAIDQPTIRRLQASSTTAR